MPWVLLMLGIAFLAWETGRHRAAAPTDPGVLPTLGQFSVIVLGPNNSLQAHRDFANQMLAQTWISTSFAGSPVLPGSTWHLYRPDGSLYASGAV